MINEGNGMYILLYLPIIIILIIIFPRFHFYFYLNINLYIAYFLETFYKDLKSQNFPL